MAVGDPTLRNPPSSVDLVTDHSSKGDIQPVQITCPLNDRKTARWPANSDGMQGVGIAAPAHGADPSGSGVGFPNAYCDGEGSPMRLDVHFPSCYKQGADLHDYKNNMDWPTNGVCPPNSIHVPHLFYEVYYQTNLFSNSWKEGGTTQPFLLANGDKTGYSMHGDFLSGWVPEYVFSIPASTSWWGLITNTVLV